MDSINLHVIEEGIRIFNDLSEMIEEGNFKLKIQKGGIMNPSNWFKNAVETVRRYKQEYLLSRYGVAEPSQRQPTRNKKEIQK